MLQNPIEGPLAIGYGSHFGLGLFTPDSADIEPCRMMAEGIGRRDYDVAETLLAAQLLVWFHVGTFMNFTRAEVTS